MKILYSILTSFVLFFIISTSSAQGIYQLWGMTSQGGADDIGAIFRTDGQGGNIQPVYSFPKTNLGAVPMYNQLTEYNGKFYSMTSQGGANNLGVIFEWDPVTNRYIKKYDFELASGINPHGSLVVLNNKLYGMTVFGGANDKGVIFEWDPATNVYTKKYDFTGAGGSNPYGSLVASNAKFYGMTYSGGVNDKGVIFEWNPATNVYTKKYDFDGANGSNPYGDLALKGGKFYGMTFLGGANNYGVIFEWNPNSNNYVKKLDFDLTNQGKPYGSLTLVNQKFYGMTWGRAPGAREGIIFEWDPSGNTFIKLHEYQGADGNSRGNLISHSGKLYGMSSSDYRSNGKYFGYLFELDLTTNAYTIKYRYTIQGDRDNTFSGENPYGSLVIKNEKIYGMTSEGGSSDDGVIFEFDLTTNQYAKKINLNAHDNASLPNSLVFHENHLYGITNKGGFDGLGTIFEWDFATNKIVGKHEFDGNAGLEQPSGNTRHPSGKLTFFNGSFYGLSYYMLGGGGPHPQSHIFEWNPSINNFTQKLYYGSYGNTGSLTASGDALYGIIKPSLNRGLFKYTPASNQFTSGLANQINSSDGNGVVSQNGKLYGTSNGGANNAGYIFEYDPATTSYAVKFDLIAASGSTPVGTMLLYNDKFYGMTDAGGINNIGVIFEWDPATNIYTKKYDFNSIEGGNPISSLVLNDGKFYGMTRNGGSFGLGTIFEWDPAMNLYAKKSDFNGANGRNPTGKNELTRVPVEVAGGLPGSCQAYAPVTIGAENSNKWVPITDASGLAVAEINANGNNLGIVTAFVFINNGAVREDGTKRLYLDRNITITPQFQPATPVDVRLYIRGEELLALKAAVNSNGTASGINTIADLGVFKNDDGCNPSLQKKAVSLISNAANWIDDYVLQTSVTSFSTFYFANKSSTALPLTLLEFSGKLQNNDALLSWKTENELNTQEFIVERSTDGTSYAGVGVVAAANTAGTHNYSFVDPAINAYGVSVVHYRLLQKDIDGKSTYSKVIAVSLENNASKVKVYPNPVGNQLGLQISSSANDRVVWKIINMSGVTVMNGQRTIAAGDNIVGLDVTKLSRGVYLLSVQGDKINKRIQFVKQ
ncbi:choice-of-anchor tandem repeat GloVer-containing protein [Terrimonas pollutisoli]|uniref:choice-of-anchor tandem repeat GloVer-containing protein n=1 Tax=Terrimonas pollutisoli TaxID=3034147 RepID=UPI0023ED199D|nr:choice-of-anchor tandem repeat GloVer-containing protein [Terrimonas sp. H1YJ31]